MSLARDSLKLIKIFGFGHFVMRLKFALIARLDSFSRAYQHKQIIKRHDLKGPTEVLCIGQKFLIDINDPGLHRDLLLDRLREPVATSTMLHITKNSDVFLDVGANIGYYSLLLSTRCKSVISIEPCEQNMQRLIHNISLNQRTNIFTHYCAITDRTMPVRLIKSDRSNWHIVIEAQEKDDKTVPGMTLDDFCQKEKVQPDILRFDLEGQEHGVITNAKKTLSKLHTLFFEIHTTRLTNVELAEIANTLESSGLIPYQAIRHDRPGKWQEFGADQWNKIVQGDRGVYELFFIRKGCHLHGAVDE